MTDVDRKTGVYTAPALTSTDFTFWWGDDAKPTEYFDVSIEPNPPIFDMVPLVEVQRQYTMAPSTHRQPMVILTLRNDSDFDVQFFANHVRIL